MIVIVINIHIHLDFPKKFTPGVCVEHFVWLFVVSEDGVDALSLLGCHRGHAVLEGRGVIDG